MYQKKNFILQVLAYLTFFFRKSAGRLHSASLLGPGSSLQVTPRLTQAACAACMAHRPKQSPCGRRASCGTWKRRGFLIGTWKHKGREKCQHLAHPSKRVGLRPRGLVRSRQVEFSVVIVSKSQGTLRKGQYVDEVKAGPKLGLWRVQRCSSVFDNRPNAESMMPISGWPRSSTSKVLVSFLFAMLLKSVFVLCAFTLSSFDA